MRTIIRDNYTPQLGQYHERIIIDSVNEKVWLFDCDGVFTDITRVIVENEYGEHENHAISQKFFTDEMRKAAEALSAEEGARILEDERLSGRIDSAIDLLEGAIEEEATAREEADAGLQNQIDTIKAASDVVDVVGTKAELDNYDTSALQDNDIIKVLQDETEEDAITYYRWDKTNSIFTYVGEEGPYYTQTQVDTMLGSKVDKTSITSTPSYNPMSASETLVMSQKGVAKQVLNETNGGIQISSIAGNASAGSAPSIAIGSHSETGATPATAVGYNAKATGTSALALGFGSNASGSHSISLTTDAFNKAAGARDIAIGDVSTEVAAGGTQTNCNLTIGSADRDGSSARPKATGGASTAIGHGAITASGDNSTAIGFGGIIASGANSMAIGEQRVVAAGNNDIAIGGAGTRTQVDSGAQTNSNIAIGLGATANGGGSVAFGAGTIRATGASATAIGNGTGGTVTAAGTNDVVIGSNTISTAVASGATQTSNNVAIGIGGVTSNGGNSIAIGTNNVTSNGSFSTAVGANGVYTYDSYNVAIGTSGTTAGNSSPTASSSYNFAFGGQLVAANGGNSIAIGTMNTTATATRTLALGHKNCNAAHDDSVALGTEAATGRTFEVSLGKNAVGSTPEVTKYIAHVTAGVNDTDAVNVKQMNDAITAAVGNIETVLQTLNSGNGAQ